MSPDTLAGRLRKLYGRAHMYAGHPQDDEMDADLGRHFIKNRADILEAATALEARPSRGEGWLPIESAPRDGTPILATSTNHGASEVVCWQDDDATSAYVGDEGWVNCGPTKDRFYANPRWFTHWRPLPPPPEAGEP